MHWRGHRLITIGDDNKFRIWNISEKGSKPVASKIEQMIDMATIQQAATVFIPDKKNQQPKKTAAKTGSGSISGKVIGGKFAASFFDVVLFGPDYKTNHKDTKSFTDSLKYKFSNLPNGKYWLSLRLNEKAAKAEILTLPSPSQRLVHCKGGEVKNINFRLE